jgi:hypothetical protein
MLRSFDYSLIVSLLFGGQIALAMWLVTDVTTPMLVLLLGILAAAIVVQTLASPVQSWLDIVVFSVLPGSAALREERATLRGVERALPRLQPQNDLLADEERFVRYTRQALSHYGDLSRLVASPLMTLPLMQERLEARQATSNPLECAHELKKVLEESICRLKPAGGEFGTTEEWKYFNVLYFPYVAGLKPYSRRANYAGLTPVEVQALEWFHVQVPQRTFYHWQGVAAELVAKDLMAQIRALG